MPPTAGDHVPASLYVPCPACSVDTLHNVLRGQVGGRGGFVLTAKVQCSQCGRVHQTQVREAPDRDVPVVVSEGASSVRSVLRLPEDDELAVDDVLIVDGRNVVVTAVEARGGQRPERLVVADIATVWAKDFENVAVKFAINLGQKTISKNLGAHPEDRFHVSEEYVFGRLRVTVHGIKTAEALLKRGSAAAADIVRVFAKPTRPDSRPARMNKEERERARDDARAAERERERSAGRGGARGRGGSRGAAGSSRGGGARSGGGGSAGGGDHA